MLFNLMIRRLITPKYLDHIIWVVDVHINNIVVPNISIDHGIAINFITKETMLKLNLQGHLRKTTTIL